MESRLDQVYRSVLLTKFFTKGWGSPSTLNKIITLRKELAKNGNAAKYLDSSVWSSNYITFSKEEKRDKCVIIDGEFESPLFHVLPDVCPKSCRKAYFQLVLPEKWTQPLQPLVLQFAGTGDHFFWRRRTLMAKPMVKERNIGSLIIENPFYGLRKPTDQLRSSLHYVSDLFLMGAALILESQVLLGWAEKQGFGPLSCHGISMGGHMASLAASAWPKPISLVPCLAWTSASVTFCEGVMSKAINWKLMTSQYKTTPEYRSEVWKLLSSPELNIRDLECSASKDLFLRENFLSPGAKMSIQEFRNLKTDTRIGLEVYMFMRGLMDECTHLANYSLPVDTDLIEIVAAEYDAYQPRRTVIPLDTLWPGSRIRYVPEGHVRSYLLYQNVFREAIYDSLNTYMEKYQCGS